MQISLFCIYQQKFFLCDCLKAQWTVGGTSEQSVKVFTNSRKYSPSKEISAIRYIVEPLYKGHLGPAICVLNREVSSSQRLIIQ